METSDGRWSPQGQRTEEDRRHVIEAMKSHALECANLAPTPAVADKGRDEHQKCSGDHKREQTRSARARTRGCTSASKRQALLQARPTVPDMLRTVSRLVPRWWTTSGRFSKRHCTRFPTQTGQLTSSQENPSVVGCFCTERISSKRGRCSRALGPRART